MTEPAASPFEADDRGAQSMNAAPAPDSTPNCDLTYDDIAARAYDLWVRRGNAPGSDFEDWLQAECELRQEKGGS